MKILERILTDSDINEIIEILRRVNFEENFNYLNPFISKHTFNELILRESFFNYTIFVYGEFIDEKLSKIAYYQLPDVATLSKSATLYLLGCENTSTPINMFLYNSILNLTKVFPDISKIKINIKSNMPNLKSLLKLMNDIGFKKEIELKEEFDDADLLIYSYFIN
ncbi:hypothetical protein Calkro_0723 [Caldicellulosiruptor kronotskyensis 2002]|uniref:N-acetyltransferase domain-containing protein n=1 Tax=Caldicellulosiruptor kronotskyensis (strain DSM 18902 / VKM B-2412 / 2002) TaxID=632348 RepID=E4SEX7_CALK2|nr:hypothetical protein [Caldicellulosiruptor kronotskyensis]ADQ45614.1 hypothetical protein Calkro_0723 [Caldicellulosiruptor kronotskyensis 2002]